MTWTPVTPNSTTWYSESVAFLCTEAGLRIATNTGAFIVAAENIDSLPSPWTNTP